MKIRGSLMPGKLVRLVPIAAAALLAAGCEHALLEDTIFDSEYVARHMPNEERVLGSTTFKPRPVGVVQTYCYATIGEVECYAHPQDEERYRLNGYFGPAPD
jgi:hypothetical protein